MHGSLHPELSKRACVLDFLITATTQRSTAKLTKRLPPPDIIHYLSHRHLLSLCTSLLGPLSQAPHHNVHTLPLQSHFLWPRLPTCTPHLWPHLPICTPPPVEPTPHLHPTPLAPSPHLQRLQGLLRLLLLSQAAWGHAGGGGAPSLHCFIPGQSLPRLPPHVAMVVLLWGSTHRKPRERKQLLPLSGTSLLACLSPSCPRASPSWGERRRWGDVYLL